MGEGAGAFAGVNDQMFAQRTQREGSDPAPAAPFLSYLGAIRSFLSKRVNPSDVDDMVQDVALKMHQRGTCEGIDNVEGYLFRVARNVMADHGRRSQARLDTQHEPLEDYHAPSPEPLPDRILSDRQDLDRTLEALDALPQRTRQAFFLHRFEDMSYAQIAQHMGISISAVEKNIMRAIRRLSDCRTV